MAVARFSYPHIGGNKGFCQARRATAAIPLFLYVIMSFIGYSRSMPRGEKDGLRCTLTGLPGVIGRFVKNSTLAVFRLAIAFKERF